MDLKKCTLEVVGLLRALRPAMMVRDPVGVESQHDNKIHRYYMSSYHMEGSSYHGRASDEVYHQFKGIRSTELNAMVCFSMDHRAEYYYVIYSMMLTHQKS